MKSVHLEPLTFVLRIFGKGRSYGDPYDWAATAVRVEPGVLEILGVTRPPLPSEWRALRTDLRTQGWKKVIFTRMANGKEKKHVIDPKK